MKYVLKNKSKIETAEESLIFPVTKNFMNYNIDDILYGLLQFYSIKAENNRIITKENFEKYRKIFCDYCTLTSYKLKSHIQKLLEFNLIEEGSVNILNKEYDCFIIKNKEKEEHEKINKKLLKQILDIKKPNALKIYFILLNKYKLNEKRYVFTYKSISQLLGYNSKGQNSSLEKNIKEILILFKDKRIIYYSESYETIYKNGITIPTNKKTLTYIYFIFFFSKQRKIKKINNQKILIKKKKKSYSLGEQYIYKLLCENNVKFKKEYTFADCKDKRKLRFDFALFDKNNKLTHLIEYNGIQHYMNKPRGYYTQEKLNGIKHRDVIKIKYCKDNDIPLIIIPYTKPLKSITIQDLVTY